MVQCLILPVNKSLLTVGYKNEWYPTHYRGQTHYGVDVVHANGKTHLYGCGDGVVTHCGYDHVCGNVVVIQYPNCKLVDGRVLDLVVRYFHMDKISVKVGDEVDINKLLGYYGKTGQQVNGSHLHLEVDFDYNYPEYTPSLKGNSNILKASPKGYPDTTLNPCDVFYLKKSPPECQSVAIKYHDSVSKTDINYKTL